MCLYREEHDQNVEFSKEHVPGNKWEHRLPYSPHFSET